MKKFFLSPKVSKYLTIEEQVEPLSPPSEGRQFVGCKTSREFAHLLRHAKINSFAKLNLALNLEFADEALALVHFQAPSAQLNLQNLNVHPNYKVLVDDLTDFLNIKE